ncbi:MAG TPA: exodeoxyribonuclease VII small subunit [Patescibacteria group bacterium]|nr:exodeoxyribonuclease VII small subunit [Patescibacteria group bacterium]
MPKTTPSFETKLHELEKILQTLEGGEIELEKSLEQYQKGMKIAEDLKTYLNEFENKVKKVRGEK